MGRRIQNQFPNMPKFTIVPTAPTETGKIDSEEKVCWIEDVEVKSTKPRGRTPKGKKWEEGAGWISDPNYVEKPKSPKPNSTKPRGRAPKGKKWTEEGWISDPNYVEEPKPSKPKSAKPRGRTPKGKKWTEEGWIEDPNYIEEPKCEKVKSTKPRGRAPNGKKWTEEGWISDPNYVEEPKPSKPKSAKPRGRAPKGKKWCEEKCEWIEDPEKSTPIVRPKIQFQRITDGSGKVRFILKRIPLPKKKMGSKEVNKEIHQCLKKRNTEGLKAALKKGGSLAYYNFEGICRAAERGHMDIFQVVFEQVDYTELIDQELGEDLYETALEEGHKKVAEYINSKRGNLKENLENANLSGMDAYEA
jgi:hypothetical protein